jgi:hypothetical protein
MSTQYCAVCCRDTTDEHPPVHRHLTRFFDQATQSFWTQWPTTRELVAFEQFTAAHSQEQLFFRNAWPPLLPPEVQDYTALTEAFDALSRVLERPKATTSVLALLQEALRRLGEPA